MDKRRTKRRLVLQSVMPPTDTPRLGVVAFVAGLTAALFQTLCVAVWQPQPEPNINPTEFKQTTDV